MTSSLRALVSVPLVALLGVLAACSSEAGDVFGESGPAGPASGAGGQGPGPGGQGAGGAASSVASTGDAGPVSTSGGGAGEGGATTSGDGGASVTSSSGDGGGSVATSVGPTSTAAGPTCGDGVINGDELCDGAALGGASCQSLGFPGNGELACVDCGFDTTNCVKCGNGTIDPGEDCDDGGALPNDGCGTNCHYEGLGCNDPIAVELDRGDAITVVTTNDEGDPALDVCGFGTAGPGRTIHVQAVSDGFLTAWVRRSGTTFDSSLRIHRECDGPVVVCADSYEPQADVHPSGGEVTSIFIPAGQGVFVFVDAFEADVVGTFSVELAFARGRCDQPVVVPVEPGSDDGIELHGLNAGQGNDESGSCGGAGQDVTYQLVPIGGGASPVDVTIEPFEAFSYNPVLHARTTCDDEDTQVECAASVGLGLPETISDLSITGGVFLHADAAAGSTGRYLIAVVPPAP